MDSDAATTPELIAYVAELLRSEGMTHENRRHLAGSHELRDFSNAPELSPLSQASELSVRLLLASIRGKRASSEDLTELVQEWAESPDAINQLLDQLPHDERFVIVRFFGLLSGRPQRLKTIARELNVPENVILAAKVRALKRLRRFYDEQIEAVHAELLHHRVQQQSATSPASMPVEQLGLIARTQNALKRAGINTVGELVALNRRQLLDIPYITPQSLEHISDRCTAAGLPYSVSS